VAKTLTIKRQLVASTKLITPGVNPGNDLAMHETDNTKPTGTAASHAALQARGNDRDASWHWQVDELEAIQSFKNSQKCWHAGDGLEGRGLNEAVAIEVCVNGDVKKAWDNAAKLAAHLLLNADDVAASTTGDIEQHFNFSGKNCPRLLRAGTHGITWAKFIANVQKYMKQKEEPNMAGMTSPAQGRVSSEYGRRAPIPGVTTGTFHAGIDIANKVGTPVYAAFAGTVVGAGTNGVPGRSGKYILIANPDGERQYYGHLNKIRVKAGQKVKQGERIGDMGATGNVTGPHLHFEIWRNSSHTSHRNPRIDFRHFGITPGSKPKATSSAPKPKPAPKPAKGKEWPHKKLLEDGKFQILTKKAYQRLLTPESVGNYTGKIDGDFATMSVKAEQRWLKKHGYYHGRIDGKRQVLTIKGVQALLYDRGFYRNGNYSKAVMVDGKWQRLSIIGLQKLINSQANLYK